MGLLPWLVSALGVFVVAVPTVDADPTRSGEGPALSTKHLTLKVKLGLAPLTLDLDRTLLTPPPRPRVNLDVAPVLARLGFGKRAQTGDAFIGLDAPSSATVPGVAAQLGLFAAKLWGTQQLCRLGRCRIDTGPGDVDDSWVEELTVRP